MLFDVTDSCICCELRNVHYGSILFFLPISLPSTFTIPGGMIVSCINHGRKRSKTDHIMNGCPFFENIPSWLIIGPFSLKPAFENLQNPAHHCFHNYIYPFIFTVCWLCLGLPKLASLILTQRLTELTTK